jgi:hypothetical protein
MMSRPLITEPPACGPSRGGNNPKTLRGPVGKERPAGPRSHIRESQYKATAWFVDVPTCKALLSRADDLKQSRQVDYSRGE